MIYLVIGVAAGVLSGMQLPNVPPEYIKLLSVALMAALDAALGGIRAAKEDVFDSEIFISGFFVNAIMAVFICFMGMKLGIDLYLVAILAFGLRMFTNIAIIRRLYLKK